MSEPVRFLVLLYQDEVGFWFRLTPPERERWVEAYDDYVRAASEAGVLAGMYRFQSFETASTVRGGHGAPEVRSGPYADTKEQLGGFLLLDVADRDAAVAWAARCPAALHGVVEVRPVWAGPA